MPRVPREEHVGVVWLQDVVVGAAVEPLDDSLASIIRGEDDAWTPDPKADVSAQLDAVEVRQPEVDEREIWPFGVEQTEGVRRRACRRDAIAAGGEDVGERSALCGVILDQQDRRRLPRREG